MWSEERLVRRQPPGRHDADEIRSELLPSGHQPLVGPDDPAWDGRIADEPRLWADRHSAASLPLSDAPGRSISCREPDEIVPPDRIGLSARRGGHDASAMTG
jgi:hypothetical protein